MQRVVDVRLPKIPLRNKRRNKQGMRNLITRETERSTMRPVQVHAILARTRSAAASEQLLPVHGRGPVAEPGKTS